MLSEEEGSSLERSNKDTPTFDSHKRRSAALLPSRFRVRLLLVIHQLTNDAILAYTTGPGLSTHLPPVAPEAWFDLVVSRTRTDIVC